MNTEYLLPLDIDLEEGSMIYTLATERDLHDKLKLSVREFPLDQLREVDMRGVGQWAAGLGVAPPMSFLFHLLRIDSAESLPGRRRLVRAERPGHHRRHIPD